MRIVMISDTHEQHEGLEIPPCDILFHAGDFSRTGKFNQLLDFNDWIVQQYAHNRVIIPGNHEISFDVDWKYAAAHISDEVTILNQSVVEINGLKIWGEPRTPAFGCGWGFNIPRHKMYKYCWSKVPKDIDVLLTHGPPYDMCDTNRFDERQGCTAQRMWIEENQPKLVICGHIHGGHGIGLIGNTLVVNAAICDENNNPTNTPIVLNL